MKRAYTIKAASVLALALAASGCDEGLTEVNRNPNAPEDVPTSAILPQGIQSAVGDVLGYNLNLDLTSLWAQQIAEIQYAEEDIYTLRTAEVNNAFRDFYRDGLMDFERIIQKGEATKKPGHTAVGLVLKSWTFGAMTDVWGDLPYSQALKGDQEGGSIRPAYDSQADIYAGILADLKKAQGMLGGGTGFGAEDLIYGGDGAKWKKFANSLRLRHAMRLSEVDPARARAEFTAALADGVFTSNADNAQLVYLASAPKQHPWHVNFKTRDDHRVSERMVRTLQSLDDPRLAVFAAATADDPGKYIGMPNGMEEHSFSWTGTSKVGAFFQKPEQPAQLQTYAEVLFLQAEAAARGWTGGNARALYEAAIRANMQYYGIPEAQIAAYLAQPQVAFSQASWREKIGTQKWIALFGNGPEVFAEWRRLDFPKLTPGPDAMFKEVPRRYAYADSEQSLNSENLTTAIKRQGGADLTSRVWWDK